MIAVSYVTLVTHEWIGGGSNGWQVCGLLISTDFTYVLRDLKFESSTKSFQHEVSIY